MSSLFLREGSSEFCALGYLKRRMVRTVLVPPSHLRPAAIGDRTESISRLGRIQRTTLADPAPPQRCGRRAVGWGSVLRTGLSDNCVRRRVQSGTTFSGYLPRVANICCDTLPVLVCDSRLLPASILVASYSSGFDIPLLHLTRTN